MPYWLKQSVDAFLWTLRDRWRLGWLMLKMKEDDTDQQMVWMEDLNRRQTERL